MFEPMGFDEAGSGDSFVKIGVGLLRKGGDNEYRFNGDYEIIRVGEWDIEHGPNRADFSQDFVGERGWAYRYRKSIRLTPDVPELIISHRLENSGAAVEFTGDAPVTRMVFWAIERAACPEPFIRLRLAPGQVSEWSSQYRFSEYETLTARQS